jgi:hypothetical protein
VFEKEAEGKEEGLRLLLVFASGVMSVQRDECDSQSFASASTQGGRNLTGRG